MTELTVKYQIKDAVVAPKERIVWLDLLRIIASFCVILNHSPLPLNGEPDAATSIYNMMTVPMASVMFFVISGSFMLPLKLEYKSFINKKFVRIAIPTFVWSILFLSILVYQGVIPSEDILSRFVLLPISPISGHLWFVYCIFGFYLFTPILSAWIEKTGKKEVEYFLGIWILTLFLPVIDLYFDFYKFSFDGNIKTSFHFYSGFIGYFILGYYLRTYPVAFKSSRFIVLILSLFVFSITFPILKYTGLAFEYIDNAMFYNRLFISVPLITCLVFILIQHVTLPFKWLRSVFVELGKVSFGIYIIHLFILRDIVWNLFGMTYIMPPFIQIPLMALIALIISYLIIKAISYLPISKYVIGF